MADDVTIEVKKVHLEGLLKLAKRVVDPKAVYNSDPVEMYKGVIEVQQMTGNEIVNELNAILDVGRL